MPWQHSELIKQNLLFAVIILASLALVFCSDGLKKQDRLDNNLADSIDINGIIPSSSDSLTVEYTLSRYNDSQKRYVDVRHRTVIDPRKSALVIIDVWEGAFIDSITIHCINPLIEQLSKLGMNIIYAPSQRQHNENLLIIDDGVIFYTHDIMDEYLFDYGIENLFYVGFDTYYCVLDKPNGIFSYRLRDYDRDMNIFLFEKGVTSYTKEMKEAAMSLLKKNNVGIIESDEADYVETFPRVTVTDLFKNTANQVDSGSNFFVIFDSDHSDRALDNFEEYLRQNGLNYGVVYDDKLIYRDQKILHSYEFITLLRQLEIRNIYYAGYHLNNEILWDEFGIILLYMKKRYYGIKGLPTIYVINDLSYIIPSPSIEPEIEKAVILNHYRNIRNILSTTLIDGLKDSVGTPD